MLTTCTGQNKSGAPCSAQAWKDGLCRWHHPELELQRAAARSKGGSARSNRARARKQIPEAMTTEELAGWLSVLFTKVIAGDIEPKVVTAAAAVARTMLDVAERTALEARLSELELAAGLGDPPRRLA